MPRPADQPWNHWFHCMTHTYGTWLPGDPKGFRTRHHREHVEGDYKHPPPTGKYDDRYRHAKSLLKREPVHLRPLQRQTALTFVIESLQRREVQVVVASLDAVHLHLLARFPDHDPRRWLGIAKKESSHYLKQTAGAPIGGLWSVRSKNLPIRDRAHQLNVVGYIFDHSKVGAAIWYHLDPPS